jgi:hypothetical protein
VGNWTRKAVDACSGGGGGADEEACPRSTIPNPASVIRGGPEGWEAEVSGEHACGGGGGDEEAPRPILPDPEESEQPPACI